MFHIKSLEMVHWDYWQRVKNIPLDAKGRIRGSLQISSPERFWGQHKFLILVER